MCSLIKDIWKAVKTNVIGSIPQTLKFTQNSSDCVLQTYSFNIAKQKKKYIHHLFNKFQPISVKLTDFPIIFFKTGSFVKYFPKNKASPNKIFIIVGFI